MASVPHTVLSTELKPRLQNSCKVISIVCCGIFFTLCENVSYEGFNKKLNGQELGKRYCRDFRIEGS